MDLTKKLPWNVCILRPAGERLKLVAYMDNSIGKRLTFSTSDSHHSLKPNITSEISPEENKKIIFTLQGVVIPIGPVLTTATAVKLFDSPKRALTV